MLYEAAFHFSITTLFYSLLYVLVNHVIFEFDFIFVNYLKYLFISILIVLFEYVLREALIKKKVEKENNSKLFVKTRNKILTVDFDDIALFHSRQGIVSILLKNSKTKWVTQFNSLKEIENILPPENFFKVNRQYIVHRDAVQIVEKDVNRKLTVHLDSSLNNGHPSEIKISRYNSRNFKKWLNGLPEIA
ncbi:LytTR family DNA-binding domain-containing protein [Flavobacteriaceae bacterium 3-367]